MVRTGARADVLRELLAAAGYRVAARSTPAPRAAELAPEPRAAVMSLYRQLGGVLDEPTLRPGAWDISLNGGVVVELDEELHFNRYRALTLAAPWARALPWTEAYRALCTRHEDDCMRAGLWGKRWTNESCERMFGPPAPAKSLAAPGGAPRWKQRALYDAIKDAAGSAPAGPRLVRLSVHDEVGEFSLGDVLAGRHDIDPHRLRALVEARTA